MYSKVISGFNEKLLLACISLIYYVSFKVCIFYLCEVITLPFHRKLCSRNVKKNNNDITKAQTRKVWDFHESRRFRQLLEVLAHYVGVLITLTSSSVVDFFVKEIHEFFVAKLSPKYCNKNIYFGNEFF